MAHTKSRRRQDEELRLKQAAQAERDKPRQERARAEAVLTVARWNVLVIRAQPLTFYPTVWAAVAARRPLLACLCPACGVVARIDLRRFRTPDLVTIDRVFPLLTCSRCRPTGPAVEIKGLWKVRR